MKVAIAHEWLSARAGSEKTFEAMACALPDADLYALSATPNVPFNFGGRRVHTSFLDKPWIRDRRDVTLPMMPLAWRYLGARATYDMVVTSSHACVKGFRPGRDAPHLCYVHSPMRYAWLPDLDERARPTRLRGYALRAMKHWDSHSTSWVDHFACNSHAVRRRIREFYDRDATVIHPPVDTDFYTLSAGGQRQEFALVVSRLVPYKRVDLAIRACELADIPLVIAGTGPDARRLADLARRSTVEVKLVGAQPDSELRSLYRRALALVFPAEEDFGIIPVEAQACGTPVVALAKGGTLETVAHGFTGELVEEATPTLFADALTRIVARGSEPRACRMNALRFSRQRFIDDFRAWALHSLGSSA
jgi:glycosyltransferase involved in cell wall biosynthesis